MLKVEEGSGAIFSIWTTTPTYVKSVFLSWNPKLSLRTSATEILQLRCHESRAPGNNFFFAKTGGHENENMSIFLATHLQWSFSGPWLSFLRATTYSNSFYSVERSNFWNLCTTPAQEGQSHIHLLIDIMSSCLFSAHAKKLLLHGLRIRLLIAFFQVRINSIFNFLSAAHSNACY